MSELKRHHINEVMDMHNLTRGKMGYSFVYYADDADKVIAEKDEEIYNIKYSRDEWAKACNQKDKEIAELKKKLMPCLNGDCILTCEVVEKYGKENAELRRHKYKRCLAVARRCHNESLWWYSKGYGFEKYDKFWEKWEKRWLEIAEQFKGGK